MNDLSVLYESHMTPITFRLLRIDALERSWSEQLQLFYICRGELSLWVQGQMLKCTENQVIAIQPMEIYRVVQGHAVAAVFGITLSAIPQLSGVSLHLPALLTPEAQSTEADKQLRTLLAEIIRASTPQSTLTAELAWQVNAYRLIMHLLDCYALDDVAAERRMQNDGILTAIRYTREHYTQTITLKQIAEVANYSIPYFSKLFTAFLGCSYTEYLTELRLQKAARLLEETTLPLRAIAEQCGFSEARTLSRAWKQAFGTLPAAARTRMTKPEDIAASGSLQTLGACLDALSNDGQRTLRTEHRILPSVALDAAGSAFRHSWQQSIGVGRAAALLRANTQHTLTELQQQTPFKRAILHGLLDDEMQVCSRNTSGRLSFSFDNVDSVLDFLLSIHLQPLMQLGFMPRALARRTDNQIYAGKSILSLPKDCGEWCALVRALILHLFARYSRRVVEGWEFCLWSKPNNPILPFGRIDEEAYFDFYRRTYMTVKECSPHIVFGSPAFLADGETKWLKTFYTRCKRYDCVPDRLRFDCYPMALSSGVEPNISERDWAQYNPDPNALRHSLETIHDYAALLELPEALPEIEEWNLSVSQRELLNDTSFKSAYIVKNALETWRLTDDMAYWAFFDNLGEATLSDQLFHGGLGLFAKGQIRKASCYAMWMLGKLGDTILAQGEGYIVTKSREGYQVLLYNYSHFSTLYADGHDFDMSFTNRYTPFVSQHRLHCDLHLTGLRAPRYQLISRLVNRRHGSAFDQWVKMGAGTLITREDADYLQGVSQPMLHKWTEAPIDGSIALSVEMEPFEIRLVQITDELENYEEREEHMPRSVYLG